jgi:hypothetical protein
MKYLKVDLAVIQVWCSVMMWRWTVLPGVLQDCHAWNSPFICLMHANEGTAVHQNIKHNQPNDMTSCPCIILLGLTVHCQNSMEQGLSWEADSSFTIPCLEPDGDSSYSPILFEIHFNALHPSILRSSRYSLSLSLSVKVHKLKFVCVVLSLT